MSSPEKNRPSARGWLPVTIGLDSQSNRPVVPWLEFGTEKLAEPFFDQTVARLRTVNPPAQETQTDLETLLKLTEGLPRVAPAGFLFHVSGCGSTLIANALRTAERTVVISEAPALSILLHPDSETLGAGGKTSWEQLREALFRSVVALLACYRTGEPEHVVIKFPSWNILYWSIVRSYWPEVPCVVMIRDPVEVMVRILGGGGWMAFKKSPALACRLFGWKNLPRTVEEMPAVEYAARVLRRFFECAGEMPEERTRILDYQDIDAGEMLGIATYFGMELEASRERIEQILGVHSKDPTGTRPFQADSANKQKLASGLVRSAAHQWAISAYRELKKRA